MYKSIKEFLVIVLILATVVGCGIQQNNADSEASSEATTEAPESVEVTKPTETSIDYIKKAADETAPDIDISGCDTFTQIVDKKLESGMGYVNTDFEDTNVLMVCSGTYDNMDGNMAAIDAAIYIYKDEAPELLGKVCSGGTAYPLAKEGKYLYTGSNHWVCKYVVSEDGIQLMEKASVEYDSNGGENYFYESEDDGDYSNIDSDEAEKIMNDLYDEMFAAEIISFDTILR